MGSMTGEVSLALTQWNDSSPPDFAPDNDTNASLLAKQAASQAASMATCGIYDFTVEAVLMGVLCLFGFVGNSLSMVCLWKDKSKTATPFLLVSLELADTLFLITVVILRVLSSIMESYPHLMPLELEFTYIGKYVFPLALTTEMWTIYLTLLVTVNRYISVCRPYEASELCSITHARKHVILVAVFSIVYNIPRFFEREVTVVLVDKVTNSTRPTLALSAMGKNQVYQLLYGNALYCVVMFCVPLITLIILNYRLIKALRKTKRKRAQLLRSTTTDSQSRSEDDITLILIVVVLVFIVCQAPALVTQLLAVILPKNMRFCPAPFFYYERISDLLVVANSSLNFIIYCFCSRKFRQILIRLVCQQGLDSPEPSQAVARAHSRAPTCSQMAAERSQVVQHTAITTLNDTGATVTALNHGNTLTVPQVAHGNGQPHQAQQPNDVVEHVQTSSGNAVASSV